MSEKIDDERAKRALLLRNLLRSSGRGALPTRGRPLDGAAVALSQASHLVIGMKKQHGGARPGAGRKPKGDVPVQLLPRLTIRLPLRLHERAVALARAEGKSLNQLVTELLEARLRSGVPRR